jgi:hypothetical protein
LFCDQKRLASPRQAAKHCAGHTTTKAHVTMNFKHVVLCIFSFVVVVYFLMFYNQLNVVSESNKLDRDRFYQLEATIAELKQKGVWVASLS